MLLLAMDIAGTAAGPMQHVRTSADGRIMVNDAPLFPIGFTTGPAPGAVAPNGRNALAELKQMGNIFQLWYCPPKEWGPEKEAELDKVILDSSRQGTRVAISIADLQSVRPSDTAVTAELRRVVTKYRENPAVLLWKGQDEPQWQQIAAEDLRIYYETVHQLDPNHPIWITQAPRGTVEDLRPYSAFYDVGAIDIYPVSYPPGTHSGIANKNLSVVGDYTLHIREATGTSKPIMMVLQICWSGVTKPGTTLRFPTFPDERYMTYQAIINGARGLVYFGGNVPGCWNDQDTAHGWNWSFYERVLRPVLEELRPDGPLYPALVAPNSKLSIHAESSAALEYVTREAGGFVYIIAAVREGPTLQAAFSGLPNEISSGEVLFEAPRKVNVKGGGFKDWFGPNEVHVYRFRRAGKEH
jgi:hypothetical protein